MTTTGRPALISAIARSIASLDRFSGGRVTIGMGAGYLKGEYRALGVDFEQRNELMDEYLKALKLALSGEEFVFDRTVRDEAGNGHRSRAIHVSLHGL